MFLSGIAKYLFSPLAVTVAAAMAGSYIFSLTLIPIAAAFLFKGKLSEAKDLRSKNWLGFFKRFIDNRIHNYQNSLKLGLRFRWPILLITAGVFVFSLYLIKGLGLRIISGFGSWTNGD